MWSAVAVARPFHITATIPANGQVGFALNGMPQATFDATAADYSAHNRTLLRLWGTEWSALRHSGL